MTYRYAADDIDCDFAPIGATCDFCDRELHEDEWQDAEEGYTRYEGVAYMEHCCSDCRVIGNRERAEHERAHARGKL